MAHSKVSFRILKYFKEVVLTLCEKPGVIHCPHQEELLSKFQMLLYLKVCFFKRKESSNKSFSNIPIGYC